MQTGFKTCCISGQTSVCGNERVFQHFRRRLALNDITKLVDARREKGYLTYKEVNDLIPPDIHSPEDLDDLLATTS